MEPIRVLLADDHYLVRSGVVRLLEGEKDMVIAGEAANGKEAVRLVMELDPDVAVIDISMPELDGLEATKIIRRQFPRTRVLVLTMHEKEEYIFQILRAGASGYILKTAEKGELASAIRTVGRGERYLGARISEVMIDAYIQKAEIREAAALPQDVHLTKREKEILGYVAQGFSNKEISETLFISPRTVDTHRTNIMQKLDIHDIATLVRYAIEHNISPQSSQE